MSLFGKPSDIKLCTLYIREFIGLPYIWGGDDPIKGFDCSGLCIEALRGVGRLPRKGDWSAHTLSTMFPPISGPQEGALVFYGSPTKITHVAYCINDKFCIEAGGGGKDNQDIEDAIYNNAYVRQRSILSRGDIVMFNNPFQDDI